MTVEPLRLVVVVASVRPGRLGPVVSKWLLRQTSEFPEFVVEEIDLADLALPTDLSPSPAVEKWTATVGAADAFVVVTPEYNHGYPAALKTALDSVKYEWRGKPIGFVSYGGLAGGVRATEQLRQIVAELHMVSVRDAVAIDRIRRAFDENGETTDRAAVDAAARMLTQLRWWAGAVAARSATDPYPG